MPESYFTLAEELLLLALNDDSGELRGEPRYLPAAVLELTVRNLVCPIPTQDPEWFPAFVRLAEQDRTPINLRRNNAEAYYQEQYQKVPSMVWKVLADSNADISLPPLESHIWSRVEAATLREKEPPIFSLSRVMEYHLATGKEVFQLGLTRLLERGILYKTEKSSFLRPPYIVYPTEKRDVKRELRERIVNWLLQNAPTLQNPNPDTNHEQQEERNRILGWLVYVSGLLPSLIPREDLAKVEERVTEAVRLVARPHSPISCVYVVSLYP